MGVFYNRCHRSMLSRKVSINCTINFNFSHFLFKIMQTLLFQAIVVKARVLNEYFYCILIHLLLIHQVTLNLILDPSN